MVRPAGDAGTALPAVDPMRPALCRIVRRARETRDTFTLTLEPGGGSAFEFQAGQFNMLYAFGVGESAISMSGRPGVARAIVHTIRAVGPVTESLQRLATGDTVGVRGPFGRGWPIEGAAGGDLVIVAGGIGLAPLRPVVYHALAHRARYGRVSILVGARSPEELIFARELDRWRGRPDIDLGVTVDRAAAGWRGSVGVVTTLLPRIAFDLTRAAAFVCGPEVMMRFVARELEGRGLPPQRIWVSMERNMKCAIGLCGHCQLGPSFICRQGPVYSYDEIGPLMAIREL